jgi:hypothetical protein
MKKIVLTIVAIMTAISVDAQTNLTGRVYHNPNIMANMMDMEVNIDKKIAEARNEAIAKMEKKKGRELTKEELAMINKKLAEIKKQADAAKKCMSTAITVEFTSATNLVMRQKTRVDDEALKIMGVGWLKRKALKASLALMPESQDAKYEVKGNKVIVIDDKDSDTLTIGNDGNTLSGIFDKKTKYILKRTK